MKTSLSKVTQILMVLAAPLALGACNKSVTDYVKAVRPIFQTPQPAPNTDGTLKVSPGQMRASTTNGAVLANVTPTNQLLSSGDVSVRVGISRGRSAPQTQ